MKVALLGDIALVRQYDKSLGDNVEKKLGELKKMLSQSDYVIANLESPLTDKTNSLVCKSMHLRSSTKNVEILRLNEKSCGI